MTKSLASRKRKVHADLSQDVRSAAILSICAEFCPDAPFPETFLCATLAEHPSYGYTFKEMPLHEFHEQFLRLVDWGFIEPNGWAGHVRCYILTENGLEAQRRATQLLVERRIVSSVEDAMRQGDGNEIDALLPHLLHVTHRAMQHPRPISLKLLLLSAICCGVSPAERENMPHYAAQAAAMLDLVDEPLEWQELSQLSQGFRDLSDVADRGGFGDVARVARVTADQLGERIH